MRGALLSADVNNPELVAMTVATAEAAVGMVAGGLARAEAPVLCWLFVRHFTRYEEEGPEAQQIRLPWRFVADGVGDCKSQAIYTAAVCAASGCRVALRFATLPGDEEPGHVYAVVDGVPVDPLLEFGKECAYIAAVDYPLN